MLTGLHHLQLAIPRGQEDRARQFYVDILGFCERPKPDSLKARGGLWLEQAGVQLHLGVEDNFRAASKAHPAFICRDLDAMAARLKQAGVFVNIDHGLPEYSRFYTQDPFGNRIEILSRTA